jgi:hypothetical protein
MQLGGEYAAVTGGLVNVKAKECESRSVEQGPELPLGGRSGRSTSKKVVLDDLLGRGSAASTAAMSSAEKRRSRGEAAAKGESRARLRQRQRRSEREAGEDADMAASLASVARGEMGGAACSARVRESCGFKPGELQRGNY